MNQLLPAIIGHLVGDFIFQNDWMAANKKRSSFACAVHCAAWTIAVCFLSRWTDPVVITWLFLTHFAIDRTMFVRNWMIFNNQEAFTKEPLAPWSIIVVDQVFHILTLFAAGVYLK